MNINVTFIKNLFDLRYLEGIGKYNLSDLSNCPVIL